MLGLKTLRPTGIHAQEIADFVFQGFDTLMSSTINETSKGTTDCKTRRLSH